MIASIGKGAYWTFLATILGLVQLWINVGYDLYKNPYSFSLYKISHEGSVLFFSLAITVGIALDFHFDDNKSKVGNLWKSTAFVFMPLIIAVFVVSAYFMICKNDPSADENIVITLNACSFVLSLIYAAGGKAYLLYK